MLTIVSKFLPRKFIIICYPWVTFNLPANVKPVPSQDSNLNNKMSKWYLFGQTWLLRAFKIDDLAVNRKKRAGIEAQGRMLTFRKLKNVSESLSGGLAKNIKLKRPGKVIFIWKDLKSKTTTYCVYPGRIEALKPQDAACPDQGFITTSIFWGRINKKKGLPVKANSFLFVTIFIWIEIRKKVGTKWGQIPKKRKGLTSWNAVNPLF